MIFNHFVSSILLSICLISEINSQALFKSIIIGLDDNNVVLGEGIVFNDNEDSYFIQNMSLSDLDVDGDLDLLECYDLNNNRWFENSQNSNFSFIFKVLDIGTILLMDWNFNDLDGAMMTVQAGANSLVPLYGFIYNSVSLVYGMTGAIDNILTGYDGLVQGLLFNAIELPFCYESTFHITGSTFNTSKTSVREYNIIDVRKRNTKSEINYELVVVVA